jgi:outer membrane protein assembly factor BamA
MQITKKVFIATLLLSFLWVNSKITCFAQTNAASKIGRSEELVEKEEALRKEAEENKKYFIKKIAVSGAHSFKPEQLQEVIAFFKKQWMSKKDIAQLLDALKELYLKGGRKEPDISYQVQKKCLDIKVNEETQPAAVSTPH